MKTIPIRHINATLREPNFAESFSIRNVQDLLDGRDMVQELHRHDFFYILILEKGKGDHQIDFVNYAIQDNCIFFMRPGQVHQLTLKAGSTGYLIGFKSNFYGHNSTTTQRLRKASNVNFYTFDSGTFNKLAALLNLIFQEYTSKQEAFQEVIKANLHIFFIELIRNRDGSSSEAVKSYSLERLDDFQELLEKHISDNKQVSEYAAMLNLSTYQLNAITKSLLGKTSSELINEQIILESKRLLLGTSSQITQIADHLGYDDVSYFIRFFKKHTGHSPEAFRNNSR